MKIKNLFLGILFMANVSAYAMMFDDPAASDMLTSNRSTHSGVEDGNNENENADAVSRFGSSSERSNEKKRVKRAQITHFLAPISESSFERNVARAPASTSEENVSRAPAGAQAAIVQPSDMVIPPRAMSRAINKQKAYQEVALIANDLGFFPSTIFVTQGIPVKLFVTGASNRSQCFMMDSFGVRRQVRSQKIEEINFTPSQGGSYVFNCPMNGAKGSVVVREIDLGGRMPASISRVEEARATPEDEEEVFSSFETNHE